MNTPPQEYERFWAALKRESEKLANEDAGIVIETGQPINGGALSVAYRVTKPGHGFPLGKAILKAGSADRREVLTLEEYDWIARDPDLLMKHDKTIEMRFDRDLHRFFLHVSDGVEVDELDAPQYFLERARDIFNRLAKGRE